jgi:hypothetical protein
MMSGGAALLVGAVGAGLVLVQGCGGDPSASSKPGASAGMDAGGEGNVAPGTGGSSAAGRSGIIVGSMAGDSGDSGGAAGQSCGATALSASRPEVNVLLVVDKSSSMNGTDEFPEGRWAALGAALDSALEQAASRVSFGLEFFPFSDDPSTTPSRCETTTGLDVLVPVAPGTESVSKISQALTAYAPAGATPTADALAEARKYFKDGKGKSLGGQSYVLLATDGGPNCNSDLACDADTCVPNVEQANATATCGGSCCDPKLDPEGNSNCLDEERTVDQVKALADMGIKTFVVGIPGSQFFAGTLDKLAAAGEEPNPDGPPSYYAVTKADGATGLTDVLTRITTGLITTCRLQLSSAPPSDPHWQSLLNVNIDGKDLPPEGADGWSVDTTTDPPTIVLEGKTCDYMEQHGAEQVKITYGCPTVAVR